MLCLVSQSVGVDRIEQAVKIVVLSFLNPPILYIILILIVVLWLQFVLHLGGPNPGTGRAIRIVPSTQSGKTREV